MTSCDQYDPPAVEYSVEYAHMENYGEDIVATVVSGLPPELPAGPDAPTVLRFSDLN